MDITYVVLGLILIVMPPVELVLLLFVKNRFTRIGIFVMPISATILYSLVFYDINSESCEVGCIFGVGFLVITGFLVFVNYLVLGIGLLISKKNDRLGIN